MGKLACQIVLGVSTLIEAVLMGSLFMNWTAITSIGLMSGLETMKVGLTHVQLVYQWRSFQGMLADYVKEDKHYLTKSFFGFPVHECNDGAAYCVDVPLYEITLKRQAGQRFEAMLSVNRASGGEMSLNAAFYGGMWVCIFQLVAMIAVAMGSGYLYFYMTRKAKKKLREYAIRFFGAAAVILILNLSVYGMAMMMMGQEIGMWQAFNGKSSAVPLFGYWATCFITFLLFFMLMSSNSWKSRTAEDIEDERKAEKEFQGMLRRGEIDESDDDSSSEEDGWQYQGGWWSRSFAGGNSRPAKKSKRKRDRGGRSRERSL